MKMKRKYGNSGVWREINVKCGIGECLKMVEVMGGKIWWGWNDDGSEMFREVEGELWGGVGEKGVGLVEGVK